jgi:hypothetical protein
MAAPVSTGMEKADMRKLLMQTKEKPVHCAIGVGKDQTLGLMVLDKMKAPKVLEKQLIDAIPDTKNTRWGTAQVDWDDDPKLVKLFLNKPISGMAKRLVKTLKGTGFSKVQIMMEDGTPVEGAAGEEEEEERETASSEQTEGVPPPPPPPTQSPTLDAGELTRRLAALAPRIPAAAGDNAERKAELLKLASLGNVNIKTNNLTYAATYIGQLEQALTVPPPPPPPPPPPTGPTNDAATLAKALAALIPRVAQVTDPAQKAVLAKLATDANVNIKTNNLTYAATYIAQLRAALERGTPTGTTEGGTDTGPAAYAKSRLDWLAARQKMLSDIDTLRDRIVEAYPDQAADLEQRYRSRVAGVIEGLDESLADTLEAARNASDPEQRQQLVADSQGIVARYQAFLASEKIIDDLDANPFVPLSIRASMTATLAALGGTLR